MKQILFTGLHLWKQESPGKVCTIREGYNSWGNLVTDQESCQSQCELDDKCIGIGYSQDPLVNDWCFICHDDDNLVHFDYSFGFYRRLGNIFRFIQRFCHSFL